MTQRTNAAPLIARSPEKPRPFNCCCKWRCYHRMRCWRPRWTWRAFSSLEARASPKIGLANYFAGAALMPYGAFLQPRRTAATISKCWPAVSGPRSNRWRTGCRPCNAPAPRASRSFSCASIRPARSPNATRPRRCNSRATAEPVRCGTCTRAFETRAVPAPTGRNPGRGALYLSGPRRVETGGTFGAPVRRYAIALGCEVRHADAWSMPIGMDLTPRHSL